MYKNHIHSDFRLNEISLNEEELLIYAKKLISSKESHEQDLGAFILEWFNKKEYITLSTSGTTGPPKKIKLQKQAVVNSAKATGLHFKLQQKNTALLCLPTKYIAGKLMFVRALVLGLHLDVVNPSSIPLNTNSKSYDFVAMVPLQVMKSIQYLHLVKKLIIGGAKLEQQVKELIINSPCEIYETYGMTETITHIAAKKITEDYFTVLPHAEISTDTRGCLVIDAPSITPDRLFTNDIIEFVDSRHFIWLGRIDNVINSGGIKLFPEQIEEKLAPFFTRRFYVISKEDVVLGNKLILVIEGDPYGVSPEIFQVLSTYEKPKEILFVSNFKETPTGKILRKESIL